MENNKKLKNLIKATFREFLNESVIEQKNIIIKFVGDNSYFDYEGEEDGVLQFSTRKNGSVSNETPSNKDILEGRNLKNKILEKFNNIDVKLEVVDEWVLIFISDIKEKVDEYKYVFIKDYDGQGFSESYDTMDELIKKRGDWIDVDWDSIKNKIEDINSFPNDDFNGWYSSKRILIKKAGEEGNNWGYNFYIRKHKKMKD